MDIDALRAEAARLAGAALGNVRVVRAPYRFCPVGAHLDHQDGEVTGFALDRGLTLAFLPEESGAVRLLSHDADGEVRFTVDRVPPRVEGDWGNYARGAVAALAARHELRRGITGVVAGEMRPGGVSTSAALGVTCLLALESSNDLVLSPDENIDLDQRIENDYLGLMNGILDQSVILHARAESLLHLDCRFRKHVHHPRPESMRPLMLMAAFSGVEEALVTTGYNRRVEECRRAAATLMRAAGQTPTSPPKLRDVPPEVFETYQTSLDEVARRRAVHYFGEMRRVRAGVAAWTSGDLDRLGEIVTETGRSSIENYECGSPPLIRLFEILTEERGVYGARFSGAGFRGYCVALVDPSRTDAIEAGVRRKYVQAFPQHAAAFHVHRCRWADGARLLPPGDRS